MKKLLFILILFALSNTGYSQIPDSSLNPETAELYKFIKEWWRTPYKWGGSTKRGIDCSAFTQKLFNNVYDVSLPRVASAQYKAGKTIQREEAKTGDLVFFTSTGPSGWHVGVYLVDNWFLHSGTLHGVFIDSLEDPKYSSKIIGFKRMM